VYSCARLAGCWPEFDLVLADGFRLGAGFAADAAGVPWASYTHHEFDDRTTSEGMVQMWCYRFPHDAPLRVTFVAWWHTLRPGLDAGPEPLPESLATWWNQSPHAALVLGLPELLGHTAPAPAWVHHVGPSLWDRLPEIAPDWLDELGPAVESKENEDREAIAEARDQLLATLDQSAELVTTITRLSRPARIDTSPYLTARPAELSGRRLSGGSR
jgi:hypothetical protein